MNLIKYTDKNRLLMTIRQAENLNTTYKTAKNRGAVL